MTEDAKERCGISSSSTSFTSNCLTSSEAESYGLWYSSLAAIINVIREAAVRFENLDLLRDFESVEGYHVLEFAIENSSTIENKEKMLELQHILSNILQ